MFNFNPLYLTDGYKVGHKAMLAPGTTKLYGTWIPRSFKHAKGVERVVSFGHQLTWRYIHDLFEEHFFFTNETKEARNKKDFQGAVDYVYKPKALQFIKDMSMYLGMEYEGKHFEELWDLGYLPIKVKALPEGIETGPNIPHMTFINTVDGFAWLTLFLETMVSNLAWKSSTAATIARLYRKQAEEWVARTDKDNMWLVDYMCHDFSARGLSGPYDMLAVALGHATSFRGSDSLIAIPGSRYFYGVKDDEMPINSVNASEHSVSTTKIFTVGEQQMIADWLQIFPKGILSIVADTFDLWKLITEYLPANKDAIMARDGKLVIRPDSGDPVDIICGIKLQPETIDGEPKIWYKGNYIPVNSFPKHERKGVIELLWEIFGGTVNEQGFKVLDPHIGAIYGDSITPERQAQIYERLAAKGFAATNIVLGVGSFTYEYMTRDTLGWAAKGSWFEVNDCTCPPDAKECPNRFKDCAPKSYNIYKDPVTDDGTKKSLKGMITVWYDERDSTIRVHEEANSFEEGGGLLQVIYEDGNFHNQVTLEQIREQLKK